MESVVTFLRTPQGTGTLNTPAGVRRGGEGKGEKGREREREGRGGEEVQWIYLYNVVSVQLIKLMLS